jgi:hypothetical protein
MGSGQGAPPAPSGAEGSWPAATVASAPKPGVALGHGISVCASTWPADCSNVGISSVPRDPTLDSSLALLKEGYAFIWNRCKQFDTDLFHARIGKPLGEARGGFVMRASVRRSKGPVSCIAIPGCWLPHRHRLCWLPQLLANGARSQCPRAEHQARQATPVPRPSRDKACKFHNRAAPTAALPRVQEGALRRPHPQSGSPYSARTATRSAPAEARAAAVARGRRGEGAARAIESALHLTARVASRSAARPTSARADSAPMPVPAELEGVSAF